MKHMYKKGQHVYAKVSLKCEAFVIEKGTECVIRGRSLFGKDYDIEVMGNPQKWMLHVAEDELSATKV